MIIAEIGTDKFALDSMKDAEALLGIIERAKQVGRGHDKDYKDYYYERTMHGDRLIINMVNGEIITEEEHEKRRSERFSKEAAESEAEALA